MPDDSYPVTSGEKARSLAEVIRTNTLDAAEGKTYAETELFLDTERRPTSDRGRALEDDRSGEPVENPAHALWIQSTALQTALMQAYMGSRIADLTMGLGGALIVSGIGLSASALEAAR